MTERINKLIYISTAVGDWDATSLHQLGAAASESNKQQDITGVLFFSKHNFIQLLEGSKTQLDELFGRISSDDRHTNIKILATSEDNSRSCPQWNMAFMNLNEIADLDTATLTNTLTDGGTAQQPLEILMRFIDQLR